MSVEPGWGPGSGACCRMVATARGTGSPRRRKLGAAELGGDRRPANIARAQSDTRAAMPRASSLEGGEFGTIQATLKHYAWILRERILALNFLNTPTSSGNTSTKASLLLEVICRGSRPKVIAKSLQIIGLVCYSDHLRPYECNPVLRATWWVMLVDTPSMRGRESRACKYCWSARPLVCIEPRAQFPNVSAEKPHPPALVLHFVSFY